MKKLVLFIALLFFIPNANAELISMEDSFFGVEINNDYNLPKEFWTDPNSYSDLNVYLYNYEGVSRPWTYLVASVCTTGYLDSWKIVNNAYNYYFQDGSLVTYRTNQTCNTGNYNGILYYMQMQVGKYQDYDGTGEELIASSHIHAINTQGYAVQQRIYNWYLSDSDFLTALKQNQDILNQMNKIESGLVSVNSGINSINSNLNGTNNKLDEVGDSIDNVNNSINNSNVDSPDNAFSQFESYLPENGVITNLITLPISLFQNVLGSINGTCSQYNLGNLLGTDLKLPCINISNYIGTTLWNVIDILFSGFFVLAIGKKMIKAFNGFTSMEEGDVLD